MRLQRRRASIALDIALVAGALLPLAIFAAVAYFTYERVQEEARADVRMRVEMFRAHMSKLIQVNLLLLDRVKERYDGLDSRAIGAKQAEHHRYLSNIRTRHPEVLSLAIIGPDGVPLAHSQQFPVSKRASAAERDYFIAQRERNAGVFVSAPLVSRIANEAGFVLSLRRAKRDGTFDGIYSASIRSSYLSEFWEDTTLHSGDETVSLVRTDGTVLARFPQLVDGENAKLPADNPLVGFMASGRLAGLWQATWAMDGQERISASRKLDGVPLYVNYAVTTQSAFAPWRRDMQSMGSVAGLATVLLLLLSLLVHRRSRSLSEANRALAEAQERFRTVADAAPVMLWITGAQGAEFVNRPALAFVGVREAEVPGFKFGRLIHPEDRDGFLGAYDRAFAAGEPFDGLCRFLGAEGEYRWMRSVGVPRHDEKGAMVGYVGASFDVQELIEAQESLRDTDKRKDEFLAALSHELRNPLSAITLSTEVLGRTPIKDAQGRSALLIISRQLGQLQRLVDDLLDTARATYDKLVLARHPVELLGVARNVVASHSQQHGSHRRISVEGEAVWVNADLARLQQMLANLIDNAVKYGAMTIAIRVRATDEFAEVAVTDDGEGLSPELLPRLFQPFAQGAQTIERARGGLGLGLALVSRLASLHGGSIRAESEGPGKGSTFTLRLPRGSAPAGGISAAPSGMQRVPPRRVLIIEDQADARDSLRMLLELDGHDVALARDGAEGLSKLASMDPDAALVDIGLPGIDGYEVARRARELPNRKRILMVALSGYAQKEDRERSREAGFDLHLAKPVAYDDLRQALAKPSVAIAAVRE